MSNAAGAGFTCTASAGAAAEILLALPASANFSSSLLPVATGSLGISQLGTPVPFTATGLNLGYAATEANITNSTVTYQ